MAAVRRNKAIIQAGGNPGDMPGPGSMNQISDQEFMLLKELIRCKCGINLSVEKKTLMRNRVSRRLKELRLQSYMDYYNFIADDAAGDELGVLINLISTSKTDFMRESHHFDFLISHVRKNINDMKELYIWSAGCSTGEEPYSIALSLQGINCAHSGMHVRILATDINTNALDDAERGVFPGTKLHVFNGEERLRYFLSMPGDRFRIRDVFRSSVQFRYVNLIEPFPFKKKFDFIFCRNVMIYFDGKDQKRLVQRLFNQLKSGGFLFIGHSESLQNIPSEFEYVKPSIYKKSGEVS